MRIVHLSDLHFGAHDDGIASALRRDIAEIAPGIVIASGDFTQVGSAAEFRQARAFLDAMPAPVLAVPGNHDLPVWNLIERFADPYRRYRRYIATDLEPFQRLDGVVFAGLKTSRRALFGLDWSDGSISRAQLRRLAARLSSAPEDDFRIVVAHHPLLHPEEETLAQDVVAEAERALKAFAKMGVQMVLSGHLHRSYLRHHSADEPVATVTTEIPDLPTRTPIIVVQSGSAISTRLRGEPNGYNVIDIEGASVAIRRRFWNDAEWVEGDWLLART